jgi:hypothetical protein
MIIALLTHYPCLPGDKAPTNSADQPTGADRLYKTVRELIIGDCMRLRRNISSSAPIQQRAHSAYRRTLSPSSSLVATYCPLSPSSSSCPPLRHKRKRAANVGILLAALVVVLVVVLALFAFLFSNNSHINTD